MKRVTLPAYLLAILGSVATITTARVACAQSPDAPVVTPPAVDVTIHDATPPRRLLSIELNPLSLIIGRYGATAVIVPVDHHALVLSPFYVSTTTNPIYVFDDQGNSTQLPTQTFSGFGGEIGYRYYSGLGGPRGLFVGPSLILAGMSAKAQDGSTTGYLDLGVAADVGYEILVVDSVAISLGAGVQYTTPTTSIPAQQFPADVYANSKVFPRALASIGWAL
jgi:hypothetical protein